MKVKTFFGFAGFAWLRYDELVRDREHMEGWVMNYEAPRFIVHGSIESLTLAHNEAHGVSPCKTNGAMSGKQVGASDFNMGQPGLGTCTPSSA